MTTRKTVCQPKPGCYLTLAEDNPVPNSTKLKMQPLAVVPSNDRFLKTEDKKWLLASEAAIYLRVPVGTIYNLVSRGKIKPSGRVGRSLRFLAKDLDAFLSSRNGGKK